MKNYALLIICFLFVISSHSFSQEEIWNAKGDRALRDNKFEDAIKFFDKAISYDKINKHSYYNRGLSKLYLQQIEESVIDFSKVIELDSLYSDAWNNRGLALSYMNLYDSALSDYNRAISIDSNFLEAYINRGSAYLGLGQIQLAVLDLDRAIKMDTANPAVFSERGRAKYFLKQYDGAVSDYSKAIELGLKSPKLNYNRANAYYNLEKYDLAIKDYTFVLKTDSMNTEALNNRAICYDKLGNKKKANADRKKLAKITGSEGRFKDFDSLKFKKYIDKSGNIELEMPHDWFVVEVHDKDMDELIITQDKINSPDEPYSVGVRLAINRNMDSLYKVRDPESLLDFWRGSAMQNAQEYHRYDIMSSKTFNRGAYKAILNKTVLQIKKDFYPLRLYELILAKEDFLFYAYFQSPEVQFGYYQKIYDKAIESLIVK